MLTRHRYEVQFLADATHDVLDLAHFRTKAEAFIVARRPTVSGYSKRRVVDLMAHRGAIASWFLRDGKVVNCRPRAR